MSKITSHFAPIVPFHPTKRDPSDEEIKTLRPKAECGDDWCLNGPPIEGANTYFLCGKCGRDSTDPVFLSCVLKNENKRRPAPPPKAQAETSVPRPHPSPIPDFDFDYMIAYCLEHYGDFAMNRDGSTATMKFLDKADRWFRYRYFLMADIPRERLRTVENHLRPADKLVRGAISGYSYEAEHAYAARLLHGLYTNYGWVLYKAHTQPIPQARNYYCKYTDRDDKTPIPSSAFMAPLARAVTEFYD